MRRLVISFGLVGALIGVGSQAVSARQDRPSPTVGYRVAPGDTLWSIAARVPGESDRRRTVHRLIELNDLGSATLIPGQRLRLPAR